MIWLLLWPASGVLSVIAFIIFGYFALENGVKISGRVIKFLIWSIILGPIPLLIPGLTVLADLYTNWYDDSLSNGVLKKASNIIKIDDNKVFIKFEKKRK